MDGSAFRNLDFSWLRWVIPLAAVEALAIGVATAYGAFWLISHIQWVW